MMDRHFQVVVMDIDHLPFLNEGVIRLADELAGRFIFAVISSRSYKQIKDDFSSKLNNFHYIIAQSGAEVRTLGKFPRRENKLVYRIKLDRFQKRLIREIVKSCGLNKKLLSDMGGQMTFDVVIDDPNYRIRKKIVKRIKQNPESGVFDIHMDGPTAINFSHKGITKIYGIEFLRNTFDYAQERVLYIGSEKALAKVAKILRGNNERDE